MGENYFSGMDASRIGLRADRAYILLDGARIQTEPLHDLGFLPYPYWSLLLFFVRVYYYGLSVLLWCYRYPNRKHPEFQYLRHIHVLRCLSIDVFPYFAHFII